MSEEEVILEGPVQHRDGKKWKSRWCVVRRLSPVADSVELSLYTSCPEDGGSGGARLKVALSLQHWLGPLTGPTLEQQSHTLLLLCADAELLLALPARRVLLLWIARLHALLGVARQYDVALLGGPHPQPAVLLLQGGRLALVQGHALKGVWEIQHLRRFGVVEGRFAWEGGALSGVGAGAHCVAAAPADVTRLQREVARAAQGLLPLHQRDRLTNNNTECNSPVSSWASEVGSLRRVASRSASPSSRGMPRCESCAAGLGSAPFSTSWSLRPPRPRRPAHLPLTCRGHHRDELCSAPTGCYDNYDVPRVPSIDAESEFYDTPRRLHAVLAGCKSAMSRSLTAGALGHPTALYATIDRSRKRPRLQQNYENSEFAHSLRLYENARDLLPSCATGPVLARAASAEYLPMRPLPRSPRRALPSPPPCSRTFSDPLLLGDDVTRSPHPSNRHSSSSADSGVALDPPAEATVPLFPRTQTDTRSTSSATSDLSDCFETMSLSSHSSLEANRSSCRSHVVPTLSSLGSLRPRSGREYASPPHPPAAPCRHPRDT